MKNPKSMAPIGLEINPAKSFAEHEGLKRVTPLKAADADFTVEVKGTK
jgi:hypothetical protein